MKRIMLNFGVILALTITLLVAITTTPTVAVNAQDRETVNEGCYDGTGSLSTGQDQAKRNVLYAGYQILVHVGPYSKEVTIYGLSQGEGTKNTQLADTYDFPYTPIKITCEKTRNAIQAKVASVYTGKRGYWVKWYK